MSSLQSGDTTATSPSNPKRAKKKRRQQRIRAEIVAATGKVTASGGMAGCIAGAAGKAPAPGESSRSGLAPIGIIPPSASWISPTPVTKANSQLGQTRKPLASVTYSSMTPTNRPIQPLTTNPAVAIAKPTSPTASGNQPLRPAKKRRQALLDTVADRVDAILQGKDISTAREMSHRTATDGQGAGKGSRKDKSPLTESQQLEKRERKIYRMAGKDSEAACKAVADTGVSGAAINPILTPASNAEENTIRAAEGKRRLEKGSKRRGGRQAAKDVAKAAVGTAALALNVVPRSTAPASGVEWPREASDEAELATLMSNATDGDGPLERKRKKKRKHGTSEDAAVTGLTSAAALALARVGNPEAARKKQKRGTFPGQPIGVIPQTQDQVNATAGPSRITSTPGEPSGPQLAGTAEQTEENARLLAETWIRKGGIEERIANHGMIVRSGTYSPAEVRMVQSAVDNYMRSNGMTPAEFHAKVDAKGRAKRGDDDFFKTIATQVPYRPLASIRAYLRAHHAAINAKGPFTREEDETIARARMLGQDWKSIGLGLERRPDDCRYRWRDHLSSLAQQRMVRWTEQENALLRNNINKYCKVNRVPITTFDPGHDGPWTTISAMMGGTRSAKRCSEHWQEVISRESVVRADGRKLRWGRKETGRLLEVLKELPRTLLLENIPWDQVHARFLTTPELDARMDRDGTPDLDSSLTGGISQQPWQEKHLRTRFRRLRNAHEGMNGRRQIGDVVETLRTTLRKGWSKRAYKAALSSAVLESDEEEEEEEV